MAKPQDKTTQQLELRLLVDINGRTGTIGAVAATDVVEGRSEVALDQAASDRDMDVYKQMSGNYFSSLQKV